MTIGQRALVVSVLTLVVTATAVGLAQIGPKFYDDDPLLREPETQDASNVQEWDNILSYGLIQNLFATPGDARRIRAQNVNTIDEVPDSNWFTNRILARPLSLEEALRGTRDEPGPGAGTDDGASSQTGRGEPGLHRARLGGRHLVRPVRRAQLRRCRQRCLDGGQPDLSCARLLSDGVPPDRDPVRDS